MSDIYALVDCGILKNSDIKLTDFVSFLEDMELSILQYRNKNGTFASMCVDIDIIRANFSGTLIVNDSIKLAALADGLHLGQEDLDRIDTDRSRAVSIVRETVGDKLLGISTHNPREITEANGLDIDYIGLGAYSASSTKSDAVVIGKRVLEYAALSKHPVAVIGGVGLNDEFPSGLIRYRVIGSALCKLYRETHQKK